MTITFTPVMRNYLKALYDEADEKHMRVDPETLTIVEIGNYPRVWPVGDRTPEDYELKEPK